VEHTLVRASVVDFGAGNIPTGELPRYSADCRLKGIEAVEWALELPICQSNLRLTIHVA
jgi:hypothetical protein